MLRISEGEQKSKLLSTLKIIRHSSCATAFCKGRAEKNGKMGKSGKGYFHAERKKMILSRNIFGYVSIYYFT